MKMFSRHLAAAGSVLVILLALTVSCSKSRNGNEPDDPKVEKGFTIPESVKANLNQTIASDATSATSISFTTSGPWVSKIVQTKAGVDWLSISPDHGDKAGNYTVTITTEPNTGTEARSAKVTFNCEGKTFTMNVSQEAPGYALPGLTPDEQKEKLETAAKAFLAEVDHENWKTTGEHVKTVIDIIDKTNFEQAESIIPEDSKVVTDPDGRRVTEYHYHPSEWTGHFKIENNEAVKQNGNFSDLLFETTENGHSYKFVATCTENGKKILIDEYQSEREYLHLPGELKGTVSADGNKVFDIVATLNYDSSVEDIDSITSLEDLRGSVGITLSFIFGDFKLEVGEFNLTSEGTANLQFVFSRGSNALITAGGNLYGFSIYQNEYEEREYVDWDVNQDGIIDSNDYYTNTHRESDMSFDSADVAIDIMGRVQVKGNLFFTDFESIVEEADNNCSTASDWNPYLDRLAEKYNLDVFYDGGDTRQAWLSFESFADGDYVDILPVVCFSDGTSYLVEEWFSLDRFQSVVDAAEAVVESIDEFLGSLYPEEVEPEPFVGN